MRSICAQFSWRAPTPRSNPFRKRTQLYLSGPRSLVPKYWRLPVGSIRGNYGVRHISIDAIPSVLLPPMVFSGLLLTLWAYKCFMMVVFQNKIIYMPNVPPFSRNEKIEDYFKRCYPISWHEHTVTTADGVEIKLLVGAKQNEHLRNVPDTRRPHVVTVYFQG